MMKIAFIPVLLVASAAHAVNVNGQLLLPLCQNDMHPQKSSRVVRITAQANPLKGTKIDFYSYKLESQSSQEPARTLVFSLRTDEDGRIKTPELSAGQYCVVASGPDNQFAQFLISVVPGKRARTSSFTVHLIAHPAPSEPPPPRPQWTPADEQMSIQKRVPVFRGTVTDQSGAVIPDVLIDIVKKGTEGKEHVAQLKAGSDGRFSGELLPGFYIGFFYIRSFQDQIIPFEITKEGTGDIDVVMALPSPSLAITKLDLPNNAQTN